MSRLDRVHCTLGTRGSLAARFREMSGTAGGRQRAAAAAAAKPRVNGENIGENVSERQKYKRHKRRVI